MQTSGDRDTQVGRRYIYIISMLRQEESKQREFTAIMKRAGRTSEGIPNTVILYTWVNKWLGETSGLVDVLGRPKKKEP